MGAKFELGLAEEQISILKEAIKQLQDEFNAIKNAMTRDGKLTHVHFESWADATRREMGYTGSNLEVYLRDIAYYLRSECEECQRLSEDL
jgi:hypothetical protein